jgi:hypothetical protein
MGYYHLLNNFNDSIQHELDPVCMYPTTMGMLSIDVDAEGLSIMNLGCHICEGDLRQQDQTRDLRENLRYIYVIR